MTTVYSHTINNFREIVIWKNYGKLFLSFIRSLLWKHNVTLRSLMNFRYVSPYKISNSLPVFHRTNVEKSPFNVTWTTKFVVCGTNSETTCGCNFQCVTRCSFLERYPCTDSWVPRYSIGWVFVTHRYYVMKSIRPKWENQNG